MEYSKTITLSGKRAAFIQKALAEPGWLDDMATDGESVTFLDGLYLVDVKLVGCGDEEPCWTEAVLFKRTDGGQYSEVSHTDVEDEFLGEWVLGDHEGNTFTVVVEAEAEVEQPAPVI